MKSEAIVLARMQCDHKPSTRPWRADSVSGEDRGRALPMRPFQGQHAPLATVRLRGSADISVSRYESRKRNQLLYCPSLKRNVSDRERQTPAGPLPATMFVLIGYPGIPPTALLAAPDGRACGLLEAVSTGPPQGLARERRGRTANAIIHTSIADQSRQTVPTPYLISGHARICSKRVSVLNSDDLVIPIRRGERFSVAHV